MCGQILACVVEQLETAAFFSEAIPKSKLFLTVHDAVLHILHKLGHKDVVLVSSSIKILSSLSFTCQCCNIFWNLFRIWPAPLKCNQLGSGCPPSSSSSSYQATGCSDAPHWSWSLSPPPSLGEHAPLSHGGWLPWKHREPLLWQQAFHDMSDEKASTSLQLSPSMVCVWETGEGRGLSGRM